MLDYLALLSQVNHATNAEESFTFAQCRLEKQCELFGCDNVIHPTILQAAEKWTTKQQQGAGLFFCPFAYFLRMKWSFILSRSSRNGQFNYPV